MWDAVAIGECMVELGLEGAGDPFSRDILSLMRAEDLFLAERIAARRVSHATRSGA